MTMLVNNAKFIAMKFDAAVATTLVCAIATALAPAPVQAQGFSAVISPPRFETTAPAGKTTRQVIEITHVANQPGKYRVYTNDWTLGPDGNAIFSDELAPNSCRPWVALEKRELALAANGKIRLRFEITPPADAASAECRFAVMIEGLEQVIKTEGAISFPVSGRVAVVVYAIVGNAAPKLEIISAGTTMHEGALVPQLQVTNSGDAHGRLGGFVTGVDTTGQKIDFVPEALPIMPAQTRPIPLVPNVPGGGSAKLNYPLTVTGSLEWGNQKTAISFRFDAPAGQAPSATPVPAPPPKAPALVTTPAANSK